MIKNKKGSVIVLTLVVLVSLLAAFGMFMKSIKEKAISGSVESLGNLWATSILGEYDRNLQDRYGLFGFYGNEKLVNSKIDFYKDYSFQGKNYITSKGCSSMLGDFSLLNYQLFLDQVNRSGKYLLVNKNRDPKFNNVHKDDGYLKDNGNISDGRINYKLPSEIVNCSSLGVSIEDMKNGFSNLKNIVNFGKDKYLVDKYIDVYFRNHINSKDLPACYFNNEEEYIICGKKNDSQNLQGVKNRIIAFREVLNLKYLHEDEVKLNEARVIANLITPGPESEVTKEGILATWALGESLNDYKLLINNKKVPLNKSEETWATDLKGILSAKDGYIDKNNEEGQSYEDYLKVLLNLTSERTKIYRIMDLVDINMKANYYSDFYLQNYYGGVKFSLNVNGKEHFFEKTYK